MAHKRSIDFGIGYVCLRSEMQVQSGNGGPSLDAQGGLYYINSVMTEAVIDSMIDTYRPCAVTDINPPSLVNSI